MTESSPPEHWMEALISGGEMKDATAAWARAELVDASLVDRDHAGQFWAEGWRRIADRGLLGLLVPTELGGQGEDLVTTLLALEGLGLGCRDNGLSYAVSTQLWSTQETLRRFGSSDQQHRWLPAMVAGDVLGSFAITEPETGSDTQAISTTVSASSGGARIDGHKAYVTLAPLADFIIVFATADPSLGQWGIEAWIVETGREGVTIDSTREKMGLRTCPFADVVFDGVEVPEANRIGPPKSGASIFASAMDAERGFLLACEVGNLERMIDDSVAYARERKQFGQPIGSFQGISHRIADMKIRHETSRLLLYRTAVLAAQGRGTALDAAVAKVHIGDAVTESALDAIRVHGARGYTTESLIERELRDSIGGLFSGGTPEIQRNIIARLLGLG